MTERQPTPDERAGMTWWNGLAEPERASWLSAAGSAVAADAWGAFKAARPQAAENGVPGGAPDTPVPVSRPDHHSCGDCRGGKIV